MAIPVYLQQFKAAGVYRVVFDKSTIENTDSEVLRLVVGYSEKGPFNIPVYVKDSSTFTTLFGGVSKKLEKRGVYFHRMALQMLASHPIICLNLKKFDGETVDGATVCTDFNPNFDPIDEVEIKVEDIYDTTRFWELNAEQLNDLQAVDGTIMDQYINLSATDTKANSVTYFIRKASGSKVSSYKISVNDWYSNQDEKPDFLEGQENNMISDYFAEIYVFNGRFSAKQVLASDTLKNYFVVTDSSSDGYQLKLRDKVINGFGDPVDTLDALYNDETSNPIGHWVGSLIPYFTDKQGNYQALDILFNQDQSDHHMMMSFNTDLLEEEDAANIDLSGRRVIPTEAAIKSKAIRNNGFDLNKIFDGSARTSLLGNLNAPVVADVIKFSSNAADLFTDNKIVIQELYAGHTKITGALYVKSVNEGKGDEPAYSILLQQIGKTDSERYTIDATDSSDSSEVIDTDEITTVTVICSSKAQLNEFANRLGVQVSEYAYEEDGKTIDWENTSLNTTDGVGTFWSLDGAFMNPDDPMAGPERIITSISRINYDQNSVYYDNDVNLKASFMTISVETDTQTVGKNIDVDNSVYGSSVSFIYTNTTNWKWDKKEIDGVDAWCYSTDKIYDTTLISVLHEGDCLLADDGTIDRDMDSDIDEEDKDYYYDTVYVQEVGTEYDDNGNFKFHYVRLSANCDIFKADDTTSSIDTYEAWQYQPTLDGEDSDDLSNSDYALDASYIVRVDNPLNQEIGDMVPHYLEGYTYKNARPNGTDMRSKVNWQNMILSTLTDYKGLRTGLLNKAEIDYRYIIDTFESYPVSSLKQVLAYLCKEKQSAFCISNFPAVKTFVKCPYTSFTDSNGVFNVDYVVAGYNKKKAASMKFSLPDDTNGASFIAFYTPLKFSDGYVDMTIPSAGLVSNLFMQKYMSRQPYYIVAGPNYGAITASGLVGPDYKYSSDELNVIEPFGVNCMVYRPSFGTFINANQTAKQTPVSALSKVNVRELVIYLQDEIEKVLQAYQWEFNNSTTRNAILDRANQICSLVAANGGIQAYQNVMDETNNTAEIIDNEMAILSTAIEPGMGCGKMVQELTLYRTGQMSSTITE